MRLVYFILFFAWTHGHADTWSTFKKHYDQHEYSQALTLLLENPSPQASYHYNLASVYFRLGKLPYALAHFEKAKRLHPDADTEYNLQWVRTQLSHEDTSSFLEPLRNLNTIRTGLGAFACLLGILSIFIYYQHRSLLPFKKNPATLFALFGFCVFFGLYLFQQLDKSSPAILLKNQALRSGPGDHYTELGQAREGTRILLTNTHEKSLWRQVQHDQTVGWIPEDAFLAL